MKVNSLTHMVVVVDENSGESATAALEEQLQVRQSGLKYFPCDNEWTPVQHLFYMFHTCISVFR